MNHQRFLELALHVAQWSKDPSTKVGCVIVNPNRIVVGMGFNGFPRGVEDTVERYENRPLKYMMVQHAEANAIFNASAPVQDCTAYVTHPPCCNCGGALIQAGISGVHTFEPEPGIAERFKESFATTEMMFQESNVGFWKHDRNTGRIIT